MWVKLAEYKFAPPFAQSLTAVTIRPPLTRKQRELVASCRVEVDPNAIFPNRYKVILDHLVNAPKATLRSLQAKGVVDERGVLTVPGIYTALWNQLDRDLERKAKRCAGSPTPPTPASSAPSPAAAASAAPNHTSRAETSAPNHPHSTGSSTVTVQNVGW